MTRSITIVALALVTLIIGLSLRQIDRTLALPSLEYLGEGGSHTIEGGRHFIVKRLRPFRFEQEPGPTYEAAPDERVWASSGSPPSPHVDTWLNFGSVTEDCEINFVAIDDDPDNRINVFYVDDDEVYEMNQGFVTSGSFSTNSAGELRLHAVDSIGIWLDKCENPPEPTETAPPPTVTPTVDETPTATATPTGTIEPSPTPTNTPVTPEPEETPEVTPEFTPTATKEWRYPACSRINFELSGDVAKEGTYEMRELGGRHLYNWYAQDGWKDSGWYRDIDISFKSVYVQVFYIPPEGGPRTALKIVNPAPGTEYGWMTRTVCHAVEVGWPDMPHPDEISPDATPDTSADDEAMGRADITWPGQEPDPTATPSSSLRG